MTDTELQRTEAAECALLLSHLAKLKGDVALRALLAQIIALPRHVVFGAVVIQAGALRRLITGEVLGEAQHTPLPSNTRLYKVTYRAAGSARTLTAEVIARSLAEAKSKHLTRFKSNNPKLPPCEIVDIVPMINERGYTK